MKCIKNGCDNDADDDSNYCSAHRPKQETMKRAEEDPPEER